MVFVGEPADAGVVIQADADRVGPCRAGLRDAEGLRHILDNLSSPQPVRSTNNYARLLLFLLGGISNAAKKQEYTEQDKRKKTCLSCFRSLVDMRFPIHHVTLMQTQNGLRPLFFLFFPCFSCFKISFQGSLTRNSGRGFHARFDEPFYEGR